MDTEKKNKKDKVVLVSLYNYESSAVTCLSSFLEKNGYETYVIFFKRLYINNVKSPSNQEYQLLMQKIKEIDPTVIGISLLCSGFSSIAKETITALRALKIPIIVGGVAVTISPEDYMHEEDFVCIGEGEYVFLELMDNLKNRILNKKIYEADKLVDVNDLPHPFLPDKSRVFYLDNDKFEEIENFPIYSTFTSRGCPYKCSYCCNNVFHRLYKNKGSWVRRRKVDDVIEELEIIKKNNPKLAFIKFQDDIFFIDVGWLEEFSKKYKEKIGLPFYANGHFQFCKNEKAISLFKNAGGYVVTLGIQSGSEKTRKEIFNRHNYSNEDVVKVSQLLRKYDISAKYDLIVDNPFETKKDKEETLNLLFRLKRPFRLYIHSLIYFPRTELAEYALERGVITKEDLENVKHKTLSNWIVRLDSGNEKENLFYNSLYSLADATIIPRFVVKSLSRSKFFRKNPHLLKFLKYSRLFNYIPYAWKFRKSFNSYEIKRRIKEFT